MKRQQGPVFRTLVIIISFFQLVLQLSDFGSQTNCFSFELKAILQSIYLFLTYV